jgi:phage FluMu gp28-like protein
MADERSYFMPYQKRWLDDESRVKIWEKSRRIGATYVAAFEDVRDANRGNVPSCWFSSADETAAREYIEYCIRWAGIYKIAAESLGEQVIDEKAGIKTYQVRFANGVKIHALSSNPKAFRSKGGKVTLDEFAWHDDAKGMWAAARPCITWGFPLRILSTHHGVNSLYNQFISKVRKGKLDWSLHHTPITVAVDDGLADKIAKRKLTKAERLAWLEQEQQSVADDAVWAEEYLCQPQDEATAFLTYEMISALQRDGILLPIAECGSECYVGMDIGRRHDLSVIWVLERIAGIMVTRQVLVLRQMPFAEQREILYGILRNRNVRRGCIDQTGLGMQLAEEAQRAFGGRVEPVTFTGPAKEEMAYQVKALADDRLLAIPEDFDIREDLHSLRKVVTAAGNIRFDVGASDSRQSHADRFWGLALAVHAGSTPGYTTPEILTRRDFKRDRDSRPIFGPPGEQLLTRLDRRLGAPVRAF